MQLILHDVSNKNVLALECKYPDQIVIIKLSKKLKLKYIRSYLVEAHIHPLFYVVPLQGLHFFFWKTDLHFFAPYSDQHSNQINYLFHK